MSILKNLIQLVGRHGLAGLFVMYKSAYGIKGDRIPVKDKNCIKKNMTQQFLYVCAVNYFFYSLVKIFMIIFKEFGPLQ